MRHGSEIPQCPGGTESVVHSAANVFAAPGSNRLRLIDEDSRSPIGHEPQAIAPEPKSPRPLSLGWSSLVTLQVEQRRRGTDPCGPTHVHLLSGLGEESENETVEDGQAAAKEGVDSLVRIDPRMHQVVPHFVEARHVLQGILREHRTG